VYLFEAFNQAEQNVQRNYQKYVDLLKKASYKTVIPET
jgi:hypothetical protein